MIALPVVPIKMRVAGREVVYMVRKLPLGVFIPPRLWGLRR